MQSLKFLLLLLIASNGFAQDSFTKYYMTYGQGYYDIEISQKSVKDYTLYIYGKSYDKLGGEGGISLDSKKHQLFLESLKIAKEKYIEWSEIAKTNNVKGFNKDVNTRCNASAYFDYANKWHFDYSTPLKFYFLVTEGEDIEPTNVLFIATGELKSSSNEYIDHDGFVFVFMNLEELTEFEEKISLKSVTAFIEGPKPEDLFKD